MQTPDIVSDDEWAYVLTLLPGDLEESARRSALRRCRNVPSAAALMRMIFAYAVSDLSMKDVAAWAHAMGLAKITGPGLFYRLREAEGWLAEMLAKTLAEELDAAPAGLRIRVVDATTICGPGTEGTEWRAHAMIDADRGRLCAVELSDDRVGEGYGLHPFREGDVVLGDRGYSNARGIEAVVKAGAYPVVRINPQAIRLCDTQRQRLNLAAHETRLTATEIMEFDLLVPVPPDSYSTASGKKWALSSAKAWIPARIAGARTRTDTVIWVLTTLARERIDSHNLLQLYRVRWQIELAFKRLKSLLHFDSLPSRKGPTAKSWMLARLLAAAVAEKLLDPNGSLSPWGYDIQKARLHA
jgi:Transposase DDE domain